MVNKRFFLPLALLFLRHNRFYRQSDCANLLHGRPCPMVYMDTLFLYTSHDEDITRDNFYTMDNYKLFSTVDMVNWTDRGIICAGKDFKWFTDNAWAPQAIPRKR